ncbi:hypothetical protein [Burkholderia gladioli]|uniref:hypothetical protein n=1 Tax=Burkholderia gladioli TaxID=28095 RepID=UPI00202E4C3A|nr:hypothetical protein [Burkholderia gladioli]URV27355.1 hypothetical protein NAL90_29965 [Burkholderia gladioli]
MTVIDESQWTGTGSRFACRFEAAGSLASASRFRQCVGSCSIQRSGQPPAIALIDTASAHRLIHFDMRMLDS